MKTKLNLEFVLIPAGEFLMGADRSKDRQAPSDEFPCHLLQVSDYYMGRYPVTNQQYQMFLEATGHRKPLFWVDGEYPAAKADHPVVGVSFHDAAAFCQWAAEVSGLPIRLPTEPEWEKAARGSDGRLYPWGNTWNSSLSNSKEAKRGGTTPVGQYSPAGDSPHKVADMGGNVQQWLSSLFGSYPYDPGDGREVLVYATEPRSLLPKFNETGCVANAEMFEASTDKSVLRGGSWREERQQSRCSYRSWAAPMHRSDDTGFRCCYEPSVQPGLSRL